MQTDGPESLTQPIAENPIAPEHRLIAPIWHTILVVAIMLCYSYLNAGTVPVRDQPHESPATRIVQYAGTIAFEIFLLVLVWFGLRLKKFTMRELIGGRWESIEDVLIDFGIALGFWVVSALILVGLAFLLGQVNAAGLNEMKRRLGPILPQTGFQAATFVVISIVAGFVEEIIFRGYLQKQIGALAKNIYAGLLVSAIIFGASHGYEGPKNMVRIAVFGALFGLLALWRKSLRPGMMAHAWQDGLAGVGSYIGRRMGQF